MNVFPDVRVSENEAKFLPVIHFVMAQSAVARHTTATAIKMWRRHSDFCCVWHQLQQKLVQKECDKQPRLLTCNNCYRRRSNQMLWPHIRATALVLQYNLSVCVTLYIRQQLIWVWRLVFESWRSGSCTLLMPFRVCAATHWPLGLTSMAHLKFHCSVLMATTCPVCQSATVFPFHPIIVLQCLAR